MIRQWATAPPSAESSAILCNSLIPSGTIPTLDLTIAGTPPQKPTHCRVHPLSLPPQQSPKTQLEQAQWSVCLLRSQSRFRRWCLDKSPPQAVRPLLLCGIPTMLYLWIHLNPFQPQSFPHSQNTLCIRLLVAYHPHLWSRTPWLTSRS